MRSGCASIVLLDLKQSEAQTAAEELVEFAASEHLELNPLKVAALECDVSSEVSVAKAFIRTLEVFGRVDAVVASAGIIENYSALDYPSDRIKRLYDVNVHGAFFTAREAAKYMIPQGGGSIILVASMSANIVNIPQLQTPYNASKAAVKHRASSLAVEWATKGVRVNTLRCEAMRLASN
jgi:NAD(P)-dependent dehydrogenase (short-subunit alcohol dehydrogenase family)